MKRLLIVLLLLIFYTTITFSQENGSIELNGTWKFDPSPSSEYWSNLTKINELKDIQVPGEWLMQGLTVEEGTTAAYYKSFHVSENWSDQVIYLHCDAVFSEASIWVNGKIIGTHTGPMVAFNFDISDQLEFGKENTIVIGVTSETLADTLMSGSQYAAHQTGGILRKIYLKAVPKVHLDHLVIETDFDSKYVDAVLKISGSLNNFGNAESVKIKTLLFSPDGKKIPLQNSSKVFLFKQLVANEIKLSYPIVQPQKWDAERPNLYRLEIIVKSNYGTQSIQRNIGFRELEIVGNILFVNGKSVKLKGVNRHEVHPLRGRSLTPELCKQDAELFKKANINYIRTSHYPPSEEFVEWCDKLGLFIEIENPLCWIGHGANRHWKTNDPHAPELYKYLEFVSKNNIDFFRNHPSLIIWSMANESQWGPNWKKLADFYIKTDSTRPVTFHDQAYGTFNNFGSTYMPVANFHYPGPAGGVKADNYERPLLFGEYCHLNTYNRTEIVTDPGVRDHWGTAFKKMWDNMYKSRGCLGGAIWSGIDDVFYLPDGRSVGYGEWGPIDGWRRPKPEYYHVKKTYSPVLVHTRKINFPLKNESINLLIENRFDFTNLNECSINWKTAGDSGKVIMDLPPHQSGVFRINPNRPISEGNILTITFTSPQGIEVNVCRVEIGEMERRNFPFLKVNSSSLSGIEKNEDLIISGESFNWKFNINQGKLESGSVAGKTVISGGADLMILSLTTSWCATEHNLHIPPHNDICKNWNVTETSWKNVSDTIVVTVTGSYDEAEGTIMYYFSGEGNLRVDYDLKSKIEINPRQWGLVFSTPEDVKNLQWNRNGFWSWYPENHIGRNNGVAEPFGEKAFLIESFGKEPTSEWRFDANELGTNDFRATRGNIYWASLTDGNGSGITVLSDGSQAFRSFVNEKKGIRFLVADFHTGGGDSFFGGHYSSDRRKLIKGSPVQGSINIQLLKSKE